MCRAQWVLVFSHSKNTTVECSTLRAPWKHFLFPKPEPSLALVSMHVSRMPWDAAPLPVLQGELQWEFSQVLTRRTFLLFPRCQAKDLSWSGGVGAGPRVSLPRSDPAGLQCRERNQPGLGSPWSLALWKRQSREGTSSNKWEIFLSLKSSWLKAPVLFPQNIMQRWPWPSRTWWLSQNWSWSAKGFLSPMKRVQDNAGRSNILKKYIFYCSNQKTTWNDNSTVVLLGHYFLYFVKLYFFFF